MAEEEKKGMFGRLLGALDFLPFVGDDDDEEIPPEQQFFDHFKNTGKVLTNDKGQPILKFRDAINLFRDPFHKQTLNAEYEDKYPGFY